MISFLLDTHILLWAAFESGKLSFSARDAISDESNSLCFSSVSIWEVTIKRAMGKVDFQYDPELLRRLLVQDGYREIGMMSHHALGVAGLPMLHKDPFDRLLIAQARVEGLIFLTADAKVGQYGASIQLV